MGGVAFYRQGEVAFVVHAKAGMLRCVAVQHHLLEAVCLPIKQQIQAPAPPLPLSSQSVVVKGCT